MKRLQILLVLFAGVVFGSSVTGCFAIWLGVARASGPEGSTVSVECSGGEAVLLQPGRSREDIAANVYVVVANPMTWGTVGGTTYYSPVLAAPNATADGSAIANCAGAASTVDFYLR